MITEPLRGWREVVVGDQRTAIYFALVVRHLVDVHFSDVERIVLAMDQLNIHTPGSLYEAFPPAEAKRLANKLEIHHTPKHGSWLNMAETELSVLTRRRLDRRIPDRHTLVDEVSAWGHDRNVNQLDIAWQFTTDDARIELCGAPLCQAVVQPTRCSGPEQFNELVNVGATVSFGNRRWLGITPDYRGRAASSQRISAVFGMCCRMSSRPIGVRIGVNSVLA